VPAWTRSPPKDPRVLGCNCAACPHAVNGASTKPVWGEYPHPDMAEGVLVGEGPGETEEDKGLPFQGLTGRELDLALAKAGIPRNRQAVLNAQKCRPLVKSAANMKRASDCCRPALEWELEPYRGKPMFLMGKWAWYSVAGKVPKGGLEKGRGFVRKGIGGGLSFTYISSWHPTYAAFRNPFEWGAFELDLARYRRLMDGRLKARPSKLITSPTLRDVAQVVKDAKGLPALDIETAPEHPDRGWTAKDPLRAKLCLVGLGCEDWGLSVDWNRASDSMKQALLDVVRGISIDGLKRDVDGNVVRATPQPPSILTHNGPWYDHRNLAKYGFRLNRFWEDTRDKRRAISATSRLSLAYCATLYDDPPPWKEEDGDEDDDKGLIVVTDVEAWKRYNCIDTVETKRIDEGMNAEPEWQEARVRELYELQKKRSVASACMHTTGIFMDVAERKRLSAELTALRDKRNQKLIDAVGLPAFRGTDGDMRAIIFARHEKEGLKRFSLPDPTDEDAYTETGLCKVDQGSLLRLVIDPTTPPELVQIIDLSWRAHAPEKLRMTHVDSVLVDQALGSDGRLRPGWNSCGTETWRESAGKPAIMTLSKEKKD
jgi:uracil-DNA glycosylase family 4